jgi:hypothetical protein
MPTRPPPRSTLALAPLAGVLLLLAGCAASAPASATSADAHTADGPALTTADAAPADRGDSPAAHDASADLPTDRRDGSSIGAACRRDGECDPDQRCSAGGENQCAGLWRPSPSSCRSDLDCRAPADAFVICAPLPGCPAGSGGMCVPGCTSDAECPGQVCLPDHHCGPKPCSAPTDCTGGLVCNAQKVCARPPCTSDASCAPDFACLPNGTCSRKRCGADSDCRVACVNGSCQPELGRCIYRFNP